MLWLLTHWRTVSVALLVGSLSIYSMVLRLERDAARTTIQEMTVAGRIAQERANAEVDRQRTVTKGIEDEHKKRTNRLSVDNQRLRDELREYARRPAVPPIPDAADGSNDPVACFDRGLLNAELEGFLQRHGARLGGIALEGEGVSAAFAACSEWVVNEAKKAQPPAESQ